MIGANTSAITTANSPRYGVHWKYEQQDSTGAWVDFSDLGGVNWCEAVEWGKTVDDPTAAPSISLRREVGSDSLAPLIEESAFNLVLSSYVPLVHMARRFRIKVAITAVGATPSSGDWFIPVEGATDGVSWGGKPGTIQVSARDDMQLLDYLVVETQSFGDPLGTPLETVMQEVLDHYLGVSAPNLEFSEALNFSVTEYTTTAGRTLRDTLDQLAGHVGAYVEHRWWSAANALRLVVMMPERASETATPVATLGPEQYLDVKRMGWSRDDVRNIVILNYYDVGTSAVESATYTNLTSIEEMGGSPFGERPIVFTEPDGSALDTAAEAQDFVDLVGADLSMPLVEQEVENLFWPWVELGDYIQWEPNFRVTDQAFTWAVVGFRHRLSATDRRTTFQTSGQAKGGVKRWQRKVSQTPAAGPPGPPGADGGDTSAFDILRIERTDRDATSIMLKPITGANVTSVIVYDRLFTLPLTGTEEIGDEENVSAILLVGDSYEALVPVPGTYRIIWFVPLSGTQVGKVRKFEIGPAKIPTAGIDDGAITSDKLVDEAVIASKLADAAVVRAKILDGAINSLKLANEAVTAAKVAVGAIDSDKIADLAVTATKIGNAAVQTAKLANEAVTSAILAANAVTETKISNDAISTPKLQAGSVVAGKIATGTITANEIASNTITAGQIASGTITSAQIAAGTITAGNIASSTITSTQIASATILAGNIASGQINADHLVAGLIEAGGIAAGSITSNELSSNSVTSDKIVSGAVTAIKIEAGAVTANKIEAGAVTADKINVSSLSAITANLGSITAGSISGVTGTFSGDLGAAVVSASGAIKLTGGRGATHSTSGAAAIQWGEAFTNGFRIIPASGTSELYVQRGNLDGSWTTVHTFS